MENSSKRMEFFFKSCYPQALGYVRKKISNYHDAENIVMDAFYSCYQRIDSFDETKASFKTWLYVVLNNKIKNYYRDHKEHSELDEDVISYDHFEDDILQAEFLLNAREYVALALETLNETQRKIIIFKYYQEKNSKEIADILGLSSGNVRIQLMRGLNKIKIFLEENNIEWEI